MNQYKQSKKSSETKATARFLSTLARQKAARRALLFRLRGITAEVSASAARVVQVFKGKCRKCHTKGHKSKDCLGIFGRLPRKSNPKVSRPAPSKARKQQKRNKKQAAAPKRKPSCDAKRKPSSSKCQQKQHTPRKSAIQKRKDRKSRAQAQEMLDMMEL